MSFKILFRHSLKIILFVYFIDNQVNPETFTHKLQKELNSSPQPCLIPFLKRSLPYLQQSLLNGEVSIEGVRPPPRTIPSVIRGAVPNQVQRPQIGIQRPQMNMIRTINPANAQAGIIRGMAPKVITPGVKTTTFVQPGGVASLQQRVGALNNIGGTPTVLSHQQVREKKSNNSYSVTGELTNTLLFP